MLKAGIVAVVVVALAGIALLALHKARPSQLTYPQSEQLIINDLKASNPSANITEVYHSNSTLENRSWYMVFSIVYNGSRPCPTLLIEAFDYPATGLVPSLDNLYTTGCNVYGITGAPTYVISSPEIAIARSYASNVTPIRSYVGRFGYYNTIVTARFLPDVNASYTPLGINLTNSWLVRYRATNANYSLYAVVDQSGHMIGTYELSS